MTREETKELLPIMQAFAEGKTVQIQIRTSSEVTPLEWIDAQDIDWDREASCYRIKPESKCRPFKDAEECWQEMQKHQPFGWIKEKRSCVTACIETLYNFGFYIERRDTILKYPEAFKICSFADGEPFGAKEE